MKQLYQLLISLFLISYLSFVSAASSPLGQWTTIDDKTSEKRAIVDLFLTEKGQINGRILKTYPLPGDSPLCQKCPGKFKDKTIVGLQFLWGLKDMGHGIWDGGYVLDARDGKIYHVKLKVNGNKLYVRGYIGIAMIGRTQVWVR